MKSFKHIFFLLFFTIGNIVFAQSSYVDEWFSKNCTHCKLNNKHNSLLPDIPKNTWHNAHVSFAKGDYTKTDYYLLKDQHTSDTLKQLLQGHLLLQLGITEKAKNHFVNIFTTQNLNIQQFVYKSLGDLYYKNRIYDSIHTYYKKAFEVPIPQSRYLKSEIYENLAFIAVSNKKFKDAEISYQKILNIYKKPFDSIPVARTYSNLGNLYYEQYQDQKAKQYFDSAYVTSKTLKDLELRRSITYNLYLVNEVLKRSPEAVKYLKEYKTINDSLQKQNHVWEVAKQKEAFAIAQKQSEVDLKTAQRNVFIVILIAVLLLLIFGFIVYKKLVKQHRKIKELNFKLDKINAAKDQLFTIIAHDLRSPVAFLKQSFQLKKRNKNEKDITDNLDISKALDSLSLLLDNLLSWALNQSSLLHVNKDWFPLQPVIAQIQRQYNSLITEKNIDFSIQISSSILIYGDMELLKIAIRNCLDNAIKFTPEGGHIRIDEKIDGKIYTVSLLDSGIGIPSGQLKTIFDMSSQKVQKDTSGHKSSGLGLMLTKSMVQLNDGSIKIKQNPNGGTIINISMPFKKIA